MKIFTQLVTLILLCNAITASLTYSYEEGEDMRAFAPFTQKKWIRFDPTFDPQVIINTMLTKPTKVSIETLKALDLHHFRLLLDTLDADLHTKLRPTDYSNITTKLEDTFLSHEPEDQFFIVHTISHECIDYILTRYAERHFRHDQLDKSAKIYLAKTEIAKQAYRELTKKAGLPRKKFQAAAGTLLSMDTKKPAKSYTMSTEAAERTYAFIVMSKLVESTQSTLLPRPSAMLHEVTKSMRDNWCAIL